MVFQFGSISHVPSVKVVAGFWSGGGRVATGAAMTGGVTTVGILICVVSQPVSHRARLRVSHFVLEYLIAMIRIGALISL